MVTLPEEFIKATRELMGEERFARYLSSFDEEPPVSIRLNPRHSSSLISQSSQPVPWCEYGFYLPHRPNFTFDPLLHAGCYYVQEAASMFIHHILRTLREHSTPNPELKVLDLCAAPGGKSTCAISALPEGTKLWANEPVRQRASILFENIQKWGYPECTVTNNYPRDYARSGLMFDIILCDVPCSGEGMFRKDPQTIGEWSPGQVEKCWRLQREIVSEAWQCLRPGGILIYSTCTFNPKENEENVRWILSEFNADIIPVPTQPEWGITGSLLKGFDAPVYRFIPGLTRTEGLFVAVMRKKPAQYALPASEESRKNPKRKTKDKNEVLRVIPPFSPGEGTSVDLSYSQAIAYLRGETLTLPPETPRGILTVNFMGHPLGQVKNIGTRANNLYPKEWRIKSTHVPAEYEPVL